MSMGLSLEVVGSYGRVLGVMRICFVLQKDYYDIGLVNRFEKGEFGGRKVIQEDIIFVQVRDKERI